MTSAPPKPKPTRKPWVTIKQSFTGISIKSVIGSIFKFDSLFKLVIVGGLATGTVAVGESASAWDIIDTEPTAIEVIAIVEVDNGFTLVPASQVAPSILQRILDAAERPIIVRTTSPEIEQTLIQIGTLLETILGRLVPPGPPLLPILQENNCLLKEGHTNAGRPCLE